MPETLQSEEGQDFVAPDETQQVDDPEKAELMARSSDKYRSEEVRGLKYASSAEAVGYEDGMAEGQDYAQMNNQFAEQSEEDQAYIFDLEKEIKDSSLEQAQVRLAEMERALKTQTDQVVEVEKKWVAPWNTREKWRRVAARDELLKKEIELSFVRSLIQDKLQPKVSPENL